LTTPRARSNCRSHQMTNLTIEIEICDSVSRTHRIVFNSHTPACSECVRHTGHVCSLEHRCEQSHELVGVERHRAIACQARVLALYRGAAATVLCCLVAAVTVDGIIVIIVAALECRCDGDLVIENDRHKVHDSTNAHARTRSHMHPHSVNHSSSHQCLYLSTLALSMMMNMPSVCASNGNSDRVASIHTRGTSTVDFYRVA
jgi:hypothetical protein